MAFALAGWLVFKTIEGAGERITLSVADAQGIQAGRTTIRYQGLEVGMIRKVILSDDLKSITAEAEIYPEAKQILKSNTKFWIVRPTASITGGISGLDTLVSGIYFAVHPGDGEFKNEFTVGNEAPLNVIDDSGVQIQLTSKDLGSLNVGSGIYFKKIKVGEVLSYRLNENSEGVIFAAKINNEYAHLVNSKTRFWNVSGLSADVSLSGVQVNMESLTSLLAGGISFDSPESGEPIQSLHTFDLFHSINDTDRGINIDIQLPENHGIKSQSAPIHYEGLEVGRLNGIEFDDNFKATRAKANIDPSMHWLLKTGTEFILEKGELGLSGVKNPTNLVLGNTLSIKLGKGTDTRQFTAKTMNDILAEDAKTLKVKLQAENAWGLSDKTQLIYRGIQVGFVHQTQLNKDRIDVEVVVLPEYAHLIKSNSRFFLVGGITGEVSTDGVEVVVPAFSQMVNQAISFTSEGQSRVNALYTLYKSEIHAKHAKSSVNGVKRYTLIAKKLPSVSAGSPVLYKNFTVGKVESFALKKDHVEVDISIENRYHHFLKPNSVFWNHSGVDIKANLSGVEIDTGSLKSVLSGGISFDVIEGIQSKKGKHWHLYNNFSDAQNSGTQITLTAPETLGLNIGSHIRFQGVNVGEVTGLSPTFEADEVKIEATIYPEYADRITQSSSYFWVPRPIISISKAENLDSLLGAYIDVVPGRGSKKYAFQLHQTAEFLRGLTLVLESENRGSVSIGTPILFREFEVGAVTSLNLGRFADRVLIEIKIKDEYKHLVRQNTVFWNQSGLDVSIGLSGATVHSGTVESLIRGGISFATPERNLLEKPARKGQHFLLHAQPKAEWTKWRTAIPRD